MSLWLLQLGTIYHICPLDVGGAKVVPGEGCHATIIWLVIILLSHILDSHVFATLIG